MRYSPVALGGLTWLVWLLAAAEGRAELIQWTYDWSRSPSQVHANSPGTGYISLTDGGGAVKTASGTSNLVATNLQAHSDATSGNPDVFTNKTYTLKLSLSDPTSGKSGTLSFTGEFNGTLTADSSNIKNTFTGPTTQTLVLGNHLFTVSIGPYGPPGPTGAVNSGSIAARAEVTVSTIFQTPEPTSGALALLGGACLVFVRPGRQRR